MQTQTELEPITPLASLPTSEAVAVRESTAVEERHAEVTEAVALPAASILADPYVGVSAIPFDVSAQAVLAQYQEVPDEWIDIRPEGLLYLSHMKARRVLNLAFGFGGWAIVPIGDFRREEKGNHVILYRTFRLYVSGRFVGEVEAAGDYWTNNAAQNYADAAESCQSYALNRLAKNFGLASQCWDKQYGERWKAKYAERNADGKWSKRTTGIGAGSPVHQEVEPQTIRSTSPQSTSSSTDSAPAVPTDQPTNQHCTIYVRAAGKAWKYGSQHIQIFTDTSSTKWKAVGAANINVLNEAINKPFAQIDVEWKEESSTKDGKTYQNRVIVAARRVEGGT